MKQVVNWLSERKKINYALALAYFLFVIFLHDPMVHLSVWVMNKLERHVYDDVVAVIFLVILIATIIYFIRQLKQNQEQKELKIFFLLVTVGLILLHTQMMFVMNIEIIHSFQYGILMILIFPLTWRLGNAVYWTTLLGIIDEWYQYQILYPEKNDYFDFNDMVMNLLGAGMAAGILYSVGISEMKRPTPLQWLKSPVVISSFLIIGGVWAAIKFSFIQVYKKGEPSNAWLVLSKATGPEDFWRSLPASDITFHVMQPIEGTIIIVLLLGFYFMMDILAQRKIQFLPKR